MRLVKLPIIKQDDEIDPDTYINIDGIVSIWAMSDYEREANGWSQRQGPVTMLHTSSGANWGIALPLHEAIALIGATEQLH